jgi:hypothetical protein
MSMIRRLVLVTIMVAATSRVSNAAEDDWFDGAHYRGAGDREYLRLLDISARMMTPDAEFENMSMLYMPLWNGLVEGPTWDAWWVQNSYGTTYAALPFYREPFITFLQNSQDLWFDQMGDGKRKGVHDWVAPDGCLCDAAKPNWIYYRQGDGRIDIHDWGMEFTAAGALMQAELLLISRDAKAIEKYVPKLERCVNFIESRRDPKNDLFLAGPAGNLLAPSYAGYKKPDGTYDKAYLTGLSVTYIALLDRMIEVEKLAKRPEIVKEYEKRRECARRGLAKLTTPAGYLVRSIDPDGAVHGIYGAKEHGYLETSPNHDAIAFRVVDDAQSRKIYEKIASIPELRPHAFILPNYPSYDDMYEKPEGLWAYGTWVNGGHWSTCEGRMILAYDRLGKYEDIRKSMRQLLTFAKKFRMDNPLVKMGSDVYQPNEKINLCYDTFAPAAAMMRGLFEYIYSADNLRLIPHIPDSITQLEQRDPVRFGTKRLYVQIVGTGDITSVTTGAGKVESFTKDYVDLKYEALPDVTPVLIVRGNAKERVIETAVRTSEEGELPAPAAALKPRRQRMWDFSKKLADAGFKSSYEAEHARLAVSAIDVIAERHRLVTTKKLAPLDDATRQAAADQLYVDTASKLCDGLETVINGYEKSPDPRKLEIHRLWLQTQPK